MRGTLPGATIFLFFTIALGVQFGCDRKHAFPPPRVQEVVVMTVQPQELELTTELPGRTSPYLVAEIRPQVSGIIQKRLFTEGSDIYEGRMLYQIEPAPFQAALDSATASLEKAEANLVVTRLKFERYKTLFSEKAISQQEYDDREAALKQAEAEVSYSKAAVETARINLGYTRVTAPITGRIGKSSLTDGALVTAYQALALATIQKLNPIFVDVPQSTAELLRLKRRIEDGRLNQEGKDESEVRLILEDGREYPTKGRLQFRDITVDPTTGSVILRIVFPNPEGVLLPGMFVRAVVKEGTNGHAILIPQGAVSRDPKGMPYALVVDAEEKVQQQMLSVDRAIGDKWLVASGLASGDRVIIEGAHLVRLGTSVRVVPLPVTDKACNTRKLTENAN